MADEGGHINVYMRIRPHESSFTDAFTLSRDSRRLTVHNPDSTHAEPPTFAFERVFGPDATQEEVFEGAAQRVVMSAVDGYNATIFAYGQTGSGKTWTITGGTKKYSSRGIIPRAISLVFNQMAERTDMKWTCHVSYMEIYNEVAYDLLDTNKEADSLEELNKVYLRTDDEGELHFVNLNMHQVATEDAALNLLFLGDTNRTIAETPMNPASSRSHCIFTLFLEARSEGGRKVRRSKLHLVDLAGSERASKTGAIGQRFREAININKGLHFLEQVIMMLQKNQKHIPYRNSKITHVLRDSLGGNCRTTMIATITPTLESIVESFAARVACISNKAVINEQLDANVKIAMMQKEIEALRLQLAQGGGGQAPSHSPPPDNETIQELVTAYVEDQSPDAFLQLHNPQAIHEGFRILKGTIVSMRSALKQPASDDAQQLIRELKAKVSQRDREVSVLVSILNSTKQPGQGSPTVPIAAGMGVAVPRVPAGPLSAPATPPIPAGQGQGRMAVPSGAAVPAEFSINGKTREEAQREFNTRHPDREAFDENLTLLKGVRDEAKKLSDQAKEQQKKANKAKAGLEHYRMQKAMRIAALGEEPTTDSDPEEDRLRTVLDTEKSIFRDQSSQLQELHRRAQTLESMCRRIKEQMASDFGTWYEVMKRASEGQIPPSSAPEDQQRPPVMPMNAWTADQSPTGPKSAGDGSSRTPQPIALSSQKSFGGNSSSPSPFAAPVARSPPVAGAVLVEAVRAVPSPAKSPPAQIGPTPMQARAAALSPTVMTGIKEADEDIASFYALRDKLIKQQQSRK
eukprot:m51a1_g125 putative kinesin-like protein kif6 (802) ;mRNA; r:421421-424331